LRMSLTTSPNLGLEEPDDSNLAPPRVRAVTYLEIGLRDYLTPEMKCEMVDMQLKIDACDTILHALKHGPWE
jgi:hypothetical protein